tara:strand:+ start:245 stop:1033 length:789 start_codon:yes stop_codon:yes gene_type:complete
MQDDNGISNGNAKTLVLFEEIKDDSSHITLIRSFEIVITTKLSQKFVLYLRISTAKSGGVDSNGIAAQERDINLFLDTQSAPEVVGKYVEVMSGANNERPQLQDALTLCRETGSQLLVANLSRLSRDVEFTARLLKDKKIKLRVANLPNANNFQIHLFSAIYQQEREFISLRTKAALREWKVKNPHRKLGNPRISEINNRRSSIAKVHRSTITPVIQPLRKQGMTFKEIANTLNSMGLKTSRGNVYHPMQVKRILDKSLEVV